MRFTRSAGSAAICAAAIAAGSIYSVHHVRAQSTPPIYSTPPANAMVDGVGQPGIGSFAILAA